MKLPSVRWFLPGFLHLCLCAFQVAQTGVLKAQSSPLYRAESAQRSVLEETNQYVEEIASLLAELEKNGIPSEKAAQARKVAAHLSQMAQEDMQRLAARLEALRSRGADPASQELVNILKAQAGIAESLRNLALQLASEQYYGQLASRLTSLLERQTRLRRMSLHFAQRDEQQRMSEKEKSNLEALKIQQGALSHDLKELDEFLKRILLGLKDDPQKAQLNRMIAVVAEQQPASRSMAALTAFEEGKYREAPPHLDAVLGTLARLLAELRIGPGAAQEAALQAARDLNELARAQRDLARRVENADNKGGRILAEEQNDIASRAETLHRQLQALAPDAAKMTAEAAKAMDESSLSLSARQPDRAAAKSQQERAADLLAAASKALENRAPTSPPNAQQQHAMLAELDRQTAALQNQMNRAGSGAASQEKIASELSHLQERTAPVSPPTAQMLAEAAGSTSDPTAPSPSAAAQALAQARARLQEEMRALEPKLAADRQLHKTAQEIQAALARTAQGESLLSDRNNPNSGADAALQFKAAQELANKIAAQQPSQKEALQSAANNLNQAAQQSGKLQAQQAAASAARARQALQQSLANIKNQLAGSAPGPNSEESAAEGEKSSRSGSSSSLARHGSVDEFVAFREDKNFTREPEIRLTQADRDALATLRNQPAPPQYQAQVDNYFRNLAEGQ